MHAQPPSWAALSPGQRLKGTSRAGQAPKGSAFHAPQTGPRRPLHALAHHREAGRAAGAAARALGEVQVLEDALQVVVRDLWRGARGGHRGGRGGQREVSDGGECQHVGLVRPEAGSRTPASTAAGDPQSSMDGSSAAGGLCRPGQQTRAHAEGGRRSAAATGPGAVRTARTARAPRCSRSPGAC